MSESTISLSKQDLESHVDCKVTGAEPLRVQFVITSLPVGGAETLLVNLIERLDRQLFAPEVICLKEPGALGARIAQQVPLHHHLLAHKWDLRIAWRLTQLFQRRKTDAVVTVGAGDKMFWGRLCARLAGVPVVCSALHSTGWPDGVGKLNRGLTSITSAFIACASGHADYLVKNEGFPAHRVFMIPNGVDTDRFRPNHTCRKWLRTTLDLEENTPLVGIVAALREEKNHVQLVEAAYEVLRHHPDTHFVVVGDGPAREEIEAAIARRGLSSQFHLLGQRSDTERILAGLDVFCLTSRNEANPVSILEALSCGVPAVSPDVGSVSETVLHQETGLLTTPLSATSTADAIMQLLGDPPRAQRMGAAGRELVRRSWSLDAMVGGYEKLIISLFRDAQAAKQLAANSELGRVNQDDPEGAKARSATSSNALSVSIDAELPKPQTPRGDEQSVPTLKTQMSASGPCDSDVDERIHETCPDQLADSNEVNSSRASAVPLIPGTAASSLGWSATHSNNSSTST